MWHDILMIVIGLIAMKYYRNTINEQENKKVVDVFSRNVENLEKEKTTMNGYNVIGIGEHAFDESRNSTNGHVLKNVVVSEGINRIGLLAFAGCTNLESVVLPESLTFIDMQAFLQCGKLKSINIPSRITAIQNSTFQETGFIEFEIPENVKSIDSRALGICKDLQKIKIYSKDIVIDSGAFEYGSSGLVLYGYVGSTTQTYAGQKGITFKNIEEEPEPGTTPDPEPDPVIGIMVRVNLNKEKISLKVNETYTLEATVLEASKDSLVWSSSDEAIATVKDGKITAKKTGTATITASIGDVKDTCVVTVIKQDGTVETPKNETPKDNTISTNPIPDAGMKNIILIILFISLLASYAYYKINKNYK